MNYLIKNGLLFDGINKIATNKCIAIKDGLIYGIEDNIENDGTYIEIDAIDKIIFPGLVDAHCHLRDPGFEYKEDIESGSMSALAGGFTSIACMPNTHPVVDSVSIVEYIIRKAKEIGKVNIYPIGAISKGLKGEELAEIGDMKFAGAVGISDDGCPVSSPNIMAKAIQYAQMFDIAVISHCEEKSLVQDGVMNEGIMSTILGLKGIPSLSESLMIAREIQLSKYYDCPIHIAHVSSKYSVELIREAKKNGVKITAETCPHYFTLDESMLEGFDTNLKVNPPLKTKEDVAAIIEGLKDNTIDMIVTDHAPHHRDEKNVEFDKALNGMIGFETALPLVISKLYKPGHLTLQQIVEKMCVNPSHLLRINKGVIKKGYPADITIFDANKKKTVDVNSFKSKSKNSPFDGMELYGFAEITIVNGEVNYREDN